MTRPSLSLSSDTNTLIHAMLGPDELLLMIEGPSLQAVIATVGMNYSHQTGMMNIPIAGDHPSTSPSHITHVYTHCSTNDSYHYSYLLK